MIITVVDKLTRTTKPLQRLDVRKTSIVDFSNHYGFGGKGFCSAAVMNSFMPASLPS